MNIIVITRPYFFSGEVDLVHRMFELGLPILHLRKPDSSIDELADFIRSVDSRFYDRIVLHDHHSLAPLFGLHGIHLNGRNPKPIPGWNGSVSRSCHSFEELVDGASVYDYQFLSPIYDSISKKGYRSAFSFEQLEDACFSGVIGPKVYALGGISLSNLPEICRFGFGGAALLGEPWSVAEGYPLKFDTYFADLLNFFC